MSCIKVENELKENNIKIQSCEKCKLSKLNYNKKDLSKGYGKLYGWAGGKKKCRFLFLGMNPSHKRFPGCEYAFGGINGMFGVGYKFNLLLKELDFFEEIFIDNILHCSTESNSINLSLSRLCFENLLEEIKILKPEKIITMGKQVFEIINIIFKENNIKINVVNVFHPNYVFRFKKNSIENYKNTLIKSCESEF